jgi:hypothetical protein
MAVGIRDAHHVAPSIRKKLALTSLTNGGRLVGVVHLRTESREFFFVYFILFYFFNPVEALVQGTGIEDHLQRFFSFAMGIDK